MPVTSGTFEFRLLADNANGLLATCAPVTVPVSSGQTRVDGVLAPGSLSVPPAATVAVHVSGGPGNAADWVALAFTGAPDTTAPRHRRGMSDAMIPFTLPTAPGTYEIRWYINNTYAACDEWPAPLATTPTCALFVTPAVIGQVRPARRDTWP